MRYLFLMTMLAFFSLTLAQTNSEIYLFDLSKEKNKITLKNSKNISNNEGYDNQPSFFDNRYILFASTRNDQTDIAKYDIRYNTKSWLNYTDGGEYSPLKVPERNAVSAVRLDKDGKQRLYRYMWSNGESEELIEKLVVAYYTWYDENTVVSAVIEEENLNLYVTNIKSGESKTYDSNVGRSFHRIPNTNLVSFISKKNDKQWQIKSLNPLTGAITILANTIKGVEDICWLDNETILSGKESILYKLTLKKDNNWKKIADFSAYGIDNITRLSANTSGNKLVVTGDVKENSAPISTEKDNTETINSSSISEVESIVQKQLDAYNAKNVDVFMATYSDDVKLYNYPNEILSEGKAQMRKDYISWFDRTPDLKATVKKRIIIGNKVIDEEQVTANGRIFNTVAIYEVVNGFITKVTFMQ